MTARPARRLHVALPEPLERAGGLNGYVRLLATGQSRIGLEAHVLSDVSRLGSAVRTTFPAASPTASPAAPAAVLPQDVVAFHFALSAVPYRVRNALRLRGARKVCVFHGPWHAEGAVQGDGAVRTRAKRLVEALAYRRFDTYVTASDAFGRVLTGTFGVDPARVRTVPPAVDCDRFTVGDAATARERLGLRPEGPVFACVRRLEPRMGVDVLLHALTLVPGADLLVAGTGSRRAELEDLSRRLGLGGRVRFLGRVPDEELPLVYRAADATVVPSTHLEGFGLVVLESMASGRPVVATDVGGLPQALGPFAAGWTVPAGSAEALGARMRRAVAEAVPPGPLREHALGSSPEAVARGFEEALAATARDRGAERR